MPRRRISSRAVAAGAPGRMICTPRVMISETGVMHISLATAMPGSSNRVGSDTRGISVCLARPEIRDEVRDDDRGA